MLDAEPHTFADLGFGSKLKVFDISDRAAPTLVQELTTLARPDAVRMNAAGTMLAITSNPDGGAGRTTPLALYRFADGQLSEATTSVIAGWPLDSGRLIDIDWHPTDNVVAMIYEINNTLRFAIRKTIAASIARS